MRIDTDTLNTLSDPDFLRVFEEVMKEAARSGFCETLREALNGPHLDASEREEIIASMDVFLSELEN